MKRLSVLFVLLLSFFLLLSVLMPKVLAFYWRDDFNYKTLSDLENGGWIYNGGGAIFVEPGEVSMYSTGLAHYNPFAMISHKQVSQQMTNFSVEVGILQGGMIEVTTSGHSYSIYFTGGGEMGPQPGLYDFQANGQQQFQFDVSDWNQTNLHSLALVKTGNLISVYGDGALVGSYAEPNSSADALSEVALGGGGSTYDYVSVSGTSTYPAPMPTPTPTLIQIFWPLFPSCIIALLVFLALLSGSVFLVLATALRRFRKRRMAHADPCLIDAAST